ncbi:MAG: tRNA(His) guanylyltransferase Thg1 family protein [Fimbriiglobus sp.]
MKFDELDAKMRVFETASDVCVLPEIHMVARLDGRGFTKLTKETLTLEAPFDVQMRDHMLTVVEHLMGEAGFGFVFGYTQSDEISLLFKLDEQSFGRKLRKLNSVLAGEASAKMSLILGTLAVFDCRICQLPNARLVIDYFRWRQEDAHRNALNAHCYWALRKAGQSARAATKSILGLTVAEKNEMLYQHGINFNDLPTWQKRGSAIQWEDYERESLNPKTGETVLAQRRRLTRNLELPMRDEYDQYLKKMLAG